MLDSPTLLARYRVLLARSRRFSNICWGLILAVLIALVSLPWIVPATDPGAPALTGSVVLFLQAGLAIAIFGLLSLIPNYSARQARKLGLVCSDCGRPFDANTILYAIETGLCWHCHPPVAAEEVSAPDSPLAPDSGNPYQPPLAERRQEPAASQPVPQASPTTVSGPMQLVLGGLIAYLIILQALLGSDETWWKNNRLPASLYKSPEDEARHRRNFLRNIRRYGWYLLGPMLAIPALALWLVTAYLPRQQGGFEYIAVSIATLLLSSSAAYLMARFALAGAPRWFHDWIHGNPPPMYAALEPESGLVCIQVVFSKHDLSPLPTTRTIGFRWQAAEPRPLQIRLWRRGQGVVHEQTLPVPPPGQWANANVAIPYGQAGVDARWADVKLLLVLDPPGQFELEQIRL